MEQGSATRSSQDVPGSTYTSSQIHVQTSSCFLAEACHHFSMSSSPELQLSEASTSTANGDEEVEYVIIEM